MPRFRWLRAGFVASFVASVLALVVPQPAWSQSGAPSGRTVKVIISVPPGGTIDFLVRVLGDQIGKANGPTIIVESRPGAGSLIAAEAVAKAAPDGNTLLVNTNGLLINAALRRARFDPVAGFEPICHLVSSPQILVVNSASPYQTVRDLFDAARKDAGALSIATIGPNSTQHIAVRKLMKLAGIDMTYVPFTGGAPAINALLGGHVSAVLQNYSEAGEQVHAGKLRALAVASAGRLDLLPDVPSIVEAGYPDAVTDVWFGLVAPAKTPPEQMTQLIDWFGKAIRTADVKARLLQQGLYPDGRCGADFAAHIRRQADDYARAVAEMNLKAE
jgi:tripartite-type tricarboxylate transporter receptor subunit TctC